MSLFPAYTEEGQNSEHVKVDNWLENSSFKINPIACLNEELPLKTIINDGDSLINEPRKCCNRKIEECKVKSKKQKTESARLSTTIDDKNTCLKDFFVIDKSPTKQFLKVITISRPAVSRYTLKFYLTNFSKHRKQKFKRYYKKIKIDYANVSHDESETVITNKNVDTIGTGQRDNEFVGFKLEEDLSHTTAYYSKSLAENPYDTDLWLKYVEFQDTMYAFEKTYKKGSIAKGLRVNAERKLAIIEKALFLNPNSQELHRKRLDIIVNVYPADELQNQLQNLVEKDQNNIILWQGYIEATQCSMSHCNSTTVLELYAKCLSVLHKARRNASLKTTNLEESILKMLYQCGLFLKQTGLFEKLWSLLKMYLELNLCPTLKNKFNQISTFNENQLIELEELIFKSNLPIHELWLRTEKLRESCHWLPFTGENCEDPQRLIFPEDVAELIHPITMPQNNFKLIATILTLLKVPLLPCRHTTMQDLGLNYVPWALDSVEMFLPVFLPAYSIDLKMKNFIIDHRLAIGPQYLKVLPAQEEYLEFIISVMQDCIDCLTGEDKICMIVWWFRFQRLLIALSNQELFKASQNIKKKIKSRMKNVLKLEDNRSNILFYVEYGLAENEIQNSETCISILEMAKTFTKNDLFSVSNICQDQINHCYLIRILVEQIIRDENENTKQKALKYLVEYVLGKTFSNSVLTQESINEAGSKFKHINVQLFSKEFPKLSCAQHFLPEFFCDWIICQGWFIYLTKGGIECGAFMENNLEKLDNITDEKLWQKEILYEFYVTIIFKHCLKNPGLGIFKVLDDVLHRAIENYPNNLFLLSVLAKEQSIIKCLGYPWWKLKKMIIKTGHALPIVFLIHIVNYQLQDMEDRIVDTITGQKYEIDSNFRNRILSLFRLVTKPDMCTRKCGMIWRLYLQFVNKYFDPTLTRNVYYRAVEECPWLKALYIDAAIYIPAELSQIQDLLIEKELRLHVTPEELEVLRN